MLVLMASLMSTPAISSLISSINVSFCSSSKLCTGNPKIGLSSLIPQLGLAPFCQWSGLKHLGLSVSQKSLIKKRKVNGGKVVVASLFGVGAPEALVIGAVALIVFGPKGLAEVARNLGKTLHEFQPTIRELQEVSREFKTTLEREIGLDEIPNQIQNAYTSSRTGSASTSSSVSSSTDKPSAVDDFNDAASPTTAFTTEEYLKLTEEQLKAAAAQQQDCTPPSPEESQLETQSQPGDAVKETASAAAQPQKPENEV